MKTLNMNSNLVGNFHVAFLMVVECKDAQIVSIKFNGNAIKEILVNKKKKKMITVLRRTNSNSFVLFLYFAFD